MGDAAEMQKAIDLLDEVKESIINAYQIKSGMSRTKISHIMDAETWLNAHKAKEMGFCDEVLYEEDDAAEQTGSKPDFIFSAKTAALTLMNKVLGSIPKPLAKPEHPPETPKEPEPVPEVEPSNGLQSEQEKPTDPATHVPDNRVRAADLEKRLSLLK